MCVSQNRCFPTQIQNLDPSHNLLYPDGLEPYTLKTFFCPLTDSLFVMAYREAGLVCCTHILLSNSRFLASSRSPMFAS